MSAARDSFDLLPYPTTKEIQTIIDHLTKNLSSSGGLDPNDLTGMLKKIEDSGFVKRLYGN